MKERVSGVARTRFFCSWQMVGLPLYYRAPRCIGATRRGCEPGFPAKRVSTAESGMAVKLRLKRMGRRHKSVYRLSAMESRCPRDGRVLEELGLYDPDNKSPEPQEKLNADLFKYWLGVGAVPTETVASLLKKHGIATR